MIRDMRYLKLIINNILNLLILKDLH